MKCFCGNVIDENGKALVYCQNCDQFYRIKRITEWKRKGGRIKKVIGLDRKVQNFLKAQLAL